MNYDQASRPAHAEDAEQDRGQPGKRTLTQGLPPSRAIAGAIAQPPGTTAAATVADDPFALHLWGALGAPAVPRSAVNAASRGGGINAAMKVTAYDQAGAPIETWQSRARWEGALPVQFEGTATGGRWSWSDASAASVKVNADRFGGGGRTVLDWAISHRAARVVIHVVDLDDVTALDALDLSDLHDPKALGKFVRGSAALGNALPEEVAGDGSSMDVATKPGAKRDDRMDSAQPRGERRSPTPADAADDEPREVADPEQEDALEADDEAQADAFDQALDQEIGQLLTELDGSSADGVDGDGHDDDGLAGPVDGKTGDAADAHDGSSKHHRRTGSLDGVDTTHDDLPGGAKDPDAVAGRVGGEEGGRTGGVRGGGGFSLFFGLHVAIPEALQGAVEVALILENGNITGFGVVTVRKAAREATEQLTKRSTAVVRSALKREASELVAQRMRALRKEIAASIKAPAEQLTKRQRQLRKAWGRLTRDEAKRAMRTTAWEMQRQFFDETLTAARTEAKQLRRGVRRTKDLGKRADLHERLTAVDQLADAASVKPVAGRLPLNHRYAGRDFPPDLLPPRFRSKGLHVNADGFPDFEPHALTLPSGEKRIHVELTGSRKLDERAANALVGFEERPAGYVWHHDAITGDMMLVPEELHDAVRHTGNAAVWRHAHGEEKYGK